MKNKIAKDKKAREKAVESDKSFIVKAPAGSGKTEALEISKPHTPSITGHQLWLGQTDKVIATVALEAPYEAAPNKGSVDRCEAVSLSTARNGDGSKPH